MPGMRKAAKLASTAGVGDLCDQNTAQTGADVTDAGFVVIRPEGSGSLARLENAPGRLAGAISGPQDPEAARFFVTRNRALLVSSGAASTSDAKQLFAERHCLIARAAEKIAALYAPPIAPN